jgi:hypothetical protein
VRYWKFLKQSIDEEVCNCDSRSDIDISESKKGIASGINTENEEIEELVGYSTAKRPRLEDQDD